MSTQRFKDVAWTFPTAPNGKIEQAAHVQLALLCDLRDELKANNALILRLVRVLECANTTEIPRTLKRIDRRLAQTRPLPRGRA